MNIRIILFAIGVAFAPVATAQPSDANVAEAARLFDEGVAATERGDFAAALDAFRASYAANPLPDVAYNIGQCQMALGQLTDAANTFRDYVAIVGDQMSEEERAEFDALLVALVPQIGRIAFEVSPPAARVTVDGVAVAPGAIAGWLAVVPGPHTIVASLDGFGPATARLDVAAGNLATASLVLAPIEAPTAPPEEPEADQGISSTWFWVTAGTAAALGLAGVVTGGLELADEDSFTAAADRCNAGDDVSCSAARSVYANIETEADATTALLAIAGAAATTALVLAFFTDWDGQETPPVSVGVAPIADGAGQGAVVGATIWF